MNGGINCFHWKIGRIQATQRWSLFVSTMRKMYLLSALEAKITGEKIELHKFVMHGSFNGSWISFCLMQKWGLVWFHLFIIYRFFSSDTRIFHFPSSCVTVFLLLLRPTVLRLFVCDISFFYAMMLSHKFSIGHRNCLLFILHHKWRKSRKLCFLLVMKKENIPSGIDEWLFIMQIKVNWSVYYYDY